MKKTKTIVIDTKGRKAGSRSTKLIQYNLHDLASLICAARGWQFWLLRGGALLLWRRGDAGSLRLFGVDGSGRRMIGSFSLGRGLHLLLELLCGGCDEGMRQGVE